MKFDLLPENSVIYGDPTDYDSALIGYDIKSGRAIYDYDLMIDWLMKRNNWNFDDAEGWIAYNTLGVNAENEPIILKRI